MSQKESKFFKPQNNAGLTSVKVNELKPVIEIEEIIKEVKKPLTIRISILLDEDLNFDLEGLAHSMFKTKQEIVNLALKEFISNKQFSRLPDGKRISKAGRKRKAV